MAKQESHAQCGSGPGAAHKRLDAFVGVFKAEVKLWMGPGDPVVTTGVMTNTWDLGGCFLQQRYQGDPSEGPFPDFEGRGYWGYNTVTQKYEGFWIDTASTMMMIEKGQVDAAGKVWTMTGDFADPQSGRTMTKRSMITLKDQDHHSMEMFFVQPGGGEMKAMEIRYTRKR